jgi:hypothetical protein
MIESPVLQEFLAEHTRKNIISVLKARFGPAAESLATELKTIDLDRLDEIVKLAATCRSLASFRERLTAESPIPPAD